MNHKKTKRRLYSILKKSKYISLEAYRQYLKEDTLLIKYWDGSPNWGDSVNSYLFQRITGRNILIADRVFNFLNKESLLGVGSIISGDLKNHVIWGSGFLTGETEISGMPKKVLAVRGPHSAAKLRKYHIEVPDVYGDPALLFPDLFHPKIAKRFAVGIIPHFKENDLPMIKALQERFNDEVCLIDMTGQIEEVAEKVLGCEAILSSSLHGLILAEAYGIPTCRLKLSDKLIGGDFKFNDYYSGVGISTHDVMHLDTLPDHLSFLLSRVSQKELKFDKHVLLNSLRDYLDHGMNRS